MSMPVFILGKHRSGTTWLGNILCKHPQICGVEHPEHHGIHESAYFSHLINRYGDIRYRQNFIEFVEVFSNSDYFKLMGLEKSILYNLYPCDYPEFFRRLMDVYSKSLDANIWVEKSPYHTILSKDIANYYNDSKFICIKRSLIDYIKSSIKHSKNNGGGKNLITILRLTVTRAYYNKTMNELSKKHPERCYFLKYEDLKKDNERYIKDTLDFIGLNYHSDLLKTEYAPNSSFDLKKPNENIINQIDIIFALLINFILYFVPNIFLHSFKFILKRNKKDLPPWFFKIYDEYNL